MSGESSLHDKIQKLLADLPPPALQLLERAVAKARLRGSSDPLFDLIGQQLEQGGTKKPPRMLDPMRLLMRPLEPFLIDARPPQKTSGRIWRGALPGIWTWIERHLAEDAVRYCGARLQGESQDSVHDNKFQIIENELRDAVLPKLQSELEGARQTPDTRRRFAYHLGGESQLQELEDIFVILSHADIIEALGDLFPANPSLNSPDDVEAISKQFRKLAGIQPRLPYYAGVILHNRLEQKDQLPLWAAACARTDDLRLIANSPFASLIELSLGDAALMAELCIREFTKPSENNQGLVFARNYSMLCRNLRAAVDFETQTSEWLRLLSETRLRISNALAEELGQIFQLLRRNVRPLRAFSDGPPLPPDAFDLDRLCLLISLLNIVRAHIQEFALNELVSKIQNNCENYLQMAVDSLQEELRSPQQPEDRFIVDAYIQAALRVSEVWHGEKQAATLRRAFEVLAATGPKLAANISASA